MRASGSDDMGIPPDSDAANKQGWDPSDKDMGIFWEGNTKISDWLGVENHKSSIGNYITVTAREDPDQAPILFDVTRACSSGVCDCVYRIAGRPAQLKPCRFFCEIFLRGDIDPDWNYLIRGVCFGFLAIDPDCDAEYKPQIRKIRDPIAHTFMSDKLSKEILAEAISEVESPPPPFVHTTFSVSQRMRGGSGVS